LSPLPPFPVDVAGFDPADELRLDEAAHVLYRAASRISSAFPTPDAALGELLDTSRTTDAITFVALNLAGEVCGLASAAPYRASTLLKMQLLVVDPPFQRRGVGRTLLRTVEDAARELGMSTLMVALEEYLTPPGDVPGSIAQKTLGKVAKTPDDEE